MSKGRQVEVTSARNRLDETLQHLVDRKEESPGDDIDVTSYYPPEPFLSKVPISPKKSVVKTGRKRKRRADSSDGENQDEQTVIMKLFDRSVDLALFPESTPLYPVCRAWIQNKPHDKSLGTLGKDSPNADIKPEIDDEMRESNIWELPPPIKSEDGCLYDLRVPQPVPQPNETLDIHADPRTAPPGERLLLNHMARWKQIRHRPRRCIDSDAVRQMLLDEENDDIPETSDDEHLEDEDDEDMFEPHEDTDSENGEEDESDDERSSNGTIDKWHDASQINEMQYAGSIQILKSMYDQSMLMENT